MPKRKEKKESVIKSKVVFLKSKMKIQVQFKERQAFGISTALQLIKEVSKLLDRLKINLDQTKIVRFVNQAHHVNNLSPIMCSICWTI